MDGKRLEGLRQELLASEAKLQEYREKEQLVDVEGLRALPTQEINELSSNFWRFGKHLRRRKLPICRSGRRLGRRKTCAASLPFLRMRAYAVSRQPRPLRSRPSPNSKSVTVLRILN